MSAETASSPNHDLHKLQQAVKWIVYSLLLVNWAFYVHEDWDRGTHTLDAGSTLFDWTREFATTIDVAAWLILILMLELETYVLEDQDWKGWVVKTVHGIRMLCFIMIAHTVLAFAITVKDYQSTVMVENASSLCDLVGQDLSYVYNLEYTEISAETCSDLSNESQFYKVGVDPLVSTLDGLTLERALAWADLIEVIAWLLIILAIEIVVRVQERHIHSSPVITVANRFKLFFYLILVGLAAYWAWLSHWLYTWDTFVWIAGFAVIEMNISDWRDELMEARSPA